MKTEVKDAIIARIVATALTCWGAVSQAGERAVGLFVLNGLPYAAYITNLGANASALREHRIDGYLAVGSNWWRGTQGLLETCLQLTWDAYDGASSWTRMEWIREEATSLLGNLTASGQKELMKTIKDNNMIGADRIQPTAATGRYETVVNGRIAKIFKAMLKVKSMDLGTIDLKQKWLTTDGKAALPAGSTFSDLLALATHPKGNIVEVTKTTNGVTKTTREPAELSWQGGGKTVEWGEVDTSLFD